MDTTIQKPLLKYLEDFESVLKYYNPSQETLEDLRSMPLVLLVGPTAAGRNTLIDLLVESGEYHQIVSDTTRKPRVNNGILEQNGVEYWFKTEDVMLEGLRGGEYLEAAIIHKQQVSGINISQLREAAKAQKIAVNEVEIDGAAHIHQFKPETLIIFLLPPTFDVWMERIRNRGDVDDDELLRRLVSATSEVSTALKENYYQFVINHEIHEAAKAVNELAHGRIIDEYKQRLGRDHAEQLLIDVQLFLANK